MQDKLKALQQAGELMKTIKTVSDNKKSQPEETKEIASITSIKSLGKQALIEHIKKDESFIDKIVDRASDEILNREFKTLRKKFIKQEETPQEEETSEKKINGDVIRTLVEEALKLSNKNNSEETNKTIKDHLLGELKKLNK
ncbi:MAG: hypothetical protein ATN36_07460 [Epulopiscium sp. Nele67-Bin005]|nr:MAG: hypothetical protein ATN36_07460 [Epulopiscium sp. Nele67-Bin005]